jgi:hypothetical protein
MSPRIQCTDEDIRLGLNEPALQVPTDRKWNIVTYEYSHDLEGRKKFRLRCVVVRGGPVAHRQDSHLDPRRAFSNLPAFDEACESPRPFALRVCGPVCRHRADR